MRCAPPMIARSDDKNACVLSVLNLIGSPTDCSR
jgi:hypothetical protein